MNNDDFAPMAPDPDFRPMDRGASNVAEAVRPPDIQPAVLPAVLPDATVAGPPPESQAFFPPPEVSPDDTEDDDSDGDDGELRLSVPTKVTTESEKEAAYEKYKAMAGPNAMKQTDRHMMLAAQNAWQPLRGWTYSLVPNKRFIDGQFVENAVQINELIASGWVPAEIPREYEPFHDPVRFTVLMKADRQLELENRRAVELLEERMSPRKLAGMSNHGRGDVGSSGFADAALKAGREITIEEAMANLPEKDLDTFPEDYQKLLMGDSAAGQGEDSE